jgi:ABC-2 type transport system permease protein
MVMDIKRRMRDRSAVINSFVAPILLATILGFAFGGNKSVGLLTIGISSQDLNASTIALIHESVTESALPSLIKVSYYSTDSQLQNAIDSKRIEGGIMVPPQILSSQSMISLIKHSDDVFNATFLSKSLKNNTAKITITATNQTAQEVASGIASAIYGKIYSGLLVGAVYSQVKHGNLQSFISTSQKATIQPLEAVLHSSNFGNGKNIIGYYAPSMAIIFLFIGAGLGTISIVAEKKGGTLARLAAAPIKSGSVVSGKILSILITSLVSILALWGETELFFGASWGDPAGVLIMCLATTLSMCGLAIFLTSLARDEQQAFVASVIVGFVLALLGGNFFPPGSLPPFMQTLSLATPNGWALVGFGRLSQEGVSLTGALTPIVVLLVIAGVLGTLSLVRIGRVVEL